MDRNTEMAHRLELARVFGKEWKGLDADRKRVILRDFHEAVAEDNLQAEDYRSRIGADNLRSYGDVMLVRERQGWK